MSTEPNQTGPLEQGPADSAPEAVDAAGVETVPEPAVSHEAAAASDEAAAAPDEAAAAPDAPAPAETDERPAGQPGLGGAVLGALGALATGALSAAGQALTSGKDRSDDDTPADETTTDESPADDSSSDDTPVDDTSAEDSPEAPGDDTATETPAVSETADETAADEPATGEATPDEAAPAAEEPAEASAAPPADEQVAPEVTPEPEATPDAPEADTAPVEAPVDEAPADAPTAEPTADAPAAEPTDAEPTDAPADETPAAETPAAETPAAETPAADDAPAADEAAPGQDAPAAEAPSGAPSDDAPAESRPTSPAPTPAAIPRPKVRPPRAATPATPAVATPPLAVGAAAFGRVDEAGTVHVRDGDTEREVGQYPDVPEAEAIAFYVRKFEDLAGQVHLLGQRLDNGTVPAKEARSSLGSLREQAVDAKAVGDLPALREELDRLDGLVAERTAAEDAQRAEAKAKALAEREAIVLEAEQIAATPPASMHFKNAGERMQELLDTWKTAQRSGTRLDKRTEDPLWKRFAAARSTVDRLRRAHFSQVSEQRSGTRSEKEALITRAEELQTSTDWRSASDEYRSLMDRWKAAGRLARKDDDALWARFRAAQDVFFANRTAANSAQDEEYRGNLTVKEGLAAEAEALLPVTDLAAAKQALASIQDRWDEAGRVPRDSLDRIEGRLRAVIEKVRDADSARWGKSTPDVVQRGSGLVNQLRQQVADLDTKIAEAEARGDSRTAQRAAKERDTKRAWLQQAESSLDDLSR